MYHKNLSWNPKDDEIVRVVFKHVFGHSMHQKTPIEHKITGRLLIGTGEFTKEKEAALKTLLGNKIKLTEKLPFGWISK